MKAVVITALTILVLNASVLAKPLGFPPQKSGIVQFTTPAKEVGCTYIPFDGAGGIDTGTGAQPELHCYRLAGKFDAASLGPSTKALRLKVEGKLECCKGRNVLAYGATWATGNYSCTAFKGGITCRRKAHGFTLSRTTFERW